MTTLYYDPRTKLVVCGPRKGQDVHTAHVREVVDLLRGHTAHVARCRWTTLRPWWRLWQRTPAVVITLGGAP
ncbi:hypothetical protein Dxin01_02748 [Deinococcus xinjiangensis]|uniref:Uncharacterized protein n=1 Tax=Deinococcus xinjiangensis TaxID=457454 RepID=A0ABP9VCN1_9DEIO